MVRSRISIWGLGSEEDTIQIPRMVVTTAKRQSVTMMAVMETTTAEVAALPTAEALEPLCNLVLLKMAHAAGQAGRPGAR